MDNARAPRRSSIGRKWLWQADATLAALLICYAVFGKAMALPRFAFVLTKIFSLPNVPSVYAAAVILVVEALAGLCLLAWPSDRWYRRYAATLFLAFAIVHFVILASRSRIMECGCFGVLQGSIVASLFDTPVKALGLNLVIALVLVRYDVRAFVRYTQRTIT